MQNVDFDENFCQDIGNIVKELKCKSLLDIDDLLNTLFTLEKVSKVIQSLHIGVVSGFHGIT